MTNIARMHFQRSLIFALQHFPQKAFDTQQNTHKHVVFYFNLSVGFFFSYNEVAPAEFNSSGKVLVVIVIVITAFIQIP